MAVKEDTVSAVAQSSGIARLFRPADSLSFSQHSTIFSAALSPGGHTPSLFHQSSPAQPPEFLLDYPHPSALHPYQHQKHQLRP